MSTKLDRGRFLARNPFANGLTDGLFYREKMRAIHRIAPNELSNGRCAKILDVGGGRSGIVSTLYPDAEIVNLDVDVALHFQTPKSDRASFVCGNACALPFADEIFDAVTMFDVLEHIPADAIAAQEALRVTKRGGVIIVSTPAEHWHYPYYSFMRRFCPLERELMQQWGHVRRGYTAAGLERLFAAPPERSGMFINAVTAFSHDVAFSRLRRRTRYLLYVLAAPITLAGYLLHTERTSGSEWTMAWRKP